MTLVEIVAWLTAAQQDQRRRVLRRLVATTATDEALMRTVVSAIARAGYAAELSDVVSRIRAAADPRPSPWTPAVIARLGVETDTQIARELRLSVSAVAQRRRQLGKPRSPRARLDGRRWTATEDRMLGTMTDREAAREIGVSVESVERRRVALGIPGWAQRGEPIALAKLAGAKYYEARAKGDQLAQIARRHKVSRASVAKAVQRYERRKARPQRVARTATTP
jgi:hypothetical protein